MNDVIPHAPPDRAGSAASFAQTANEVGIAMGLVVLGSIGTLVYRSGMVEGPRAAYGSWVDGFDLAATRNDAVLLGQARHAFVSGFHMVGLTGVVVMAVVLLLRVQRQRESAD